MNRLQKLKIENIKKANELLDNGHNKQYPPQVVILKPSENVTNSSNSFVNKMSNLKEEDENNVNLGLLSAWAQLVDSDEDDVVNMLKPIMAKITPMILNGQVINPPSPGAIVPFKNKEAVLTEYGADTSWSDDDDKVTLQDILELTKDIPIIPYPTKELAKIPSLKNLVLGWDPEEIERISQVEVSRQYPILVMVNEYNEVQWIVDGNHRAQQAIMNDIPTIPAKLIKPSDLDERSIKIFYPDGIPDKENLNKLTESLNEEPEKDTYWMITKANRENLIKMGGTAEDIGKSATNNFQKYCK